jgi:hypothetical protein
MKKEDTPSVSSGEVHFGVPPLGGILFCNKKIAFHAVQLYAIA